MNKKARTFFLALLSLLLNSLYAQVITTVAGNGASTYAGDGGPAVNASMSESKGVVVMKDLS